MSKTLGSPRFGVTPLEVLDVHGCHWSGKSQEIQGQRKVRDFCPGSGKFEILRKVREIQENPLKVLTSRYHELEFIMCNDPVKQCGYHTFFSRLL